MSERDKQPGGETNDRTFNEEQQPFFESDGTAEKTRQRTPGTESAPPSEPAAGEGQSGVSDVG